MPDAPTTTVTGDAPAAALPAPVDMSPAADGARPTADGGRGGQEQAAGSAATSRECAGPIDAVVASWFDRPDCRGGHVCATCGWRYGGPVCRRCWP